MDDTVASSGKKGILLREVLAKGTAKQFFLHEFAHHVDGPSGKLGTGVEAIGKLSASMYRKSLTPEFMRALGAPPNALTEGSLEEIAAARVAGIEGFANLYSQYLTNRLVLKFSNRTGYDAIRPFFEK